MSIPELEPCAWMRDLDGSGSLHVCAEGDPGSFPVYARPSPVEVEGLVEKVAALIAPCWFPNNGPDHVLNNYPGQADKYRSDARNTASKIVALITKEDALVTQDVEDKTNGK